jgi:hypothetical protein
MTRKSIALAFALAGVLGVMAQTALAGTITLRNEYFTEVCGIEVSVGDNAPDAPVQQFGGIEQPWEQVFDADKICVRRSDPVDSCGKWTEWHCCESGGGAALCALE